MIFMVLFSDHFCSAFGTDTIQATLTNQVRFFVSTIWAGTITVRTQPWLIAATAPTATLTTTTLPATSSTSPLTATALAASATKGSIDHVFYLLI
jgi:hypothetical protein